MAFKNTKPLCKNHVSKIFDNKQVIDETHPVYTFTSLSDYTCNCSIIQYGEQQTIGEGVLRDMRVIRIANSRN